MADTYLHLDMEECDWDKFYQIVKKHHVGRQREPMTWMFYDEILEKYELISEVKVHLGQGNDIRFTVGFQRHIPFIPITPKELSDRIIQTFSITDGERITFTAVDAADACDYDVMRLRFVENTNTVYVEGQ